MLITNARFKNAICRFNEFVFKIIQALANSTIKKVKVVRSSEGANICYECTQQTKTYEIVVQ